MREENEQIAFKEYQMGKKQINVDIPIMLWTDTKKNLLSFTDGAILGLKFQLAEIDKGITFDYPHNHLLDKVRFLSLKLQEANDKIALLEQGQTQITVEEEFDKELSKVI